MTVLPVGGKILAGKNGREKLAGGKFGGKAVTDHFNAKHTVILYLLDRQTL